MARLWIQESGNILYSTYRHNTSTLSVRVQSSKSKIWERNWSGMKLKTICFYNCLGLWSSVILNFQYLGETALRFYVDIWKKKRFQSFRCFILMVNVEIRSRGSGHSFAFFLFLFYFIFFIGGWGKVWGAIYLIISKSTVFKNPTEGLIVRKEKRDK